MDPPPIGDRLSKDAWFSYNTMSHVFPLLSLTDLLQCSKVCKLWNQFAMEPRYWRSVTLVGCKLKFDQMADVLENLGTTDLRLIECLFVLNDNAVFHALKKMPSLRKIELSECCSALIEQLAEANPNLEVVKANIICGLIGLNLNLSFVSKMPKLTVLQLYCNRGLDNSLESFQSAHNLQHLSLVGVKNLSFLNLEATKLWEIKSLQSLALGECWNLPVTFATEFIAKLDSLKKLRLESCRECRIVQILENISTLENLECLELIEINVDTGFQRSLALCKNLKELTVVPNAHRLKMSIFNTNIIRGVLALKETLKVLTWGFTTLYVGYMFKITDEPDSIPFMNNSNNMREQFILSMKALKDLIVDQMKNTVVNIECKDYTGSVLM